MSSFQFVLAVVVVVDFIFNVQNKICMNQQILRTKYYETNDRLMRDTSKDVGGEKFHRIGRLYMPMLQKSYPYKIVMPPCA